MYLKYIYLNESDLLYKKQFGSQKGHFTDHAIVQIADQIHDMFHKNIYTLCVFVNLSKAFNNVDPKSS